MVYNLDNEYQRIEFSHKVKELWENRKLVELTQKFPKRTNSQNRYLHLAIGWWALYYGCSRDYAKVRFFKKECNKETFLVVKESKQGGKYYDLRSSKDLTTEEMTLCIQRFRDFCAFQGCYIPSPDEHEYLLYIEREQDKNKEYL